MSAQLLAGGVAVLVGGAAALVGFRVLGPARWHARYGSRLKTAGPPARRRRNRGVPAVRTDRAVGGVAAARDR